MMFSTREKTFKPVHVVRLIEREVGKLGGEAGGEAETSGLYTLPFQLSADAPHEWARLFEKLWVEQPDAPASGDASMRALPQAAVRHDRIILTGTTVEEVRDWLKERLVRIVDLANTEFAREIEASRSAAEQGKAEDKTHRENVKKVGDEIEF